MPQAQDTMNIRIPPETKKKLKRIADREDRTLVNLVQVALKKYVKEYSTRG